MPDYSSDLFLLGAFLVKSARLLQGLVFSRRFSITGKMPDYSSDFFFFRLQSSH